MLPILRDELAAHKASSGRPRLDDPVFTTATGKPRDKDNARRRVLDPVVAHADELLAAREQRPLTQASHRTSCGTPSRRSSPR